MAKHTYINKAVLLTYFDNCQNSFWQYFVEYADFLKKNGYTVFVITDKKDIVIPIRRLKIEIFLIENKSKFKTLNFIKNLFQIKKILISKNIGIIHIFDNVFEKYLRFLKPENFKIFVNYDGNNLIKNKKIILQKYICFNDYLFDKLSNLQIKTKIIKIEFPLNAEKFNLKSVSDERFKKLIKEWNVDERTFTFLTILEEFNSFYSVLENAVYELKKMGYEFKVFALIKSENFACDCQDKIRINELEIDDCLGFVYNDLDTDCIFKMIQCYIESKENVDFSYYLQTASLFGKFALVNTSGNGTDLINQDKSGKFFNPQDMTSLMSSMKWIMDKNKKQRDEISDNILTSKKPLDISKIFEKMSEYK